jgi:hypothetical protein
LVVVVLGNEGGGPVEVFVAAGLEGEVLFFGIGGLRWGVGWGVGFGDGR